MKTHARMVKLGLDTNTATATRLIQAYNTHPCPSSLANAGQLFDQVPASSRDAFLWSTMISVNARSDHPIAAIHILSELLHLRFPSVLLSYAFASASHAAASIGDLLLARSLHAQVLRRQIIPNVVVSTSLLDMYSKCDSLVSARKVFDLMPHRNAVTWNSIIAAYAAGGMSALALELFHHVKCVEYHLVADEFAVASGFNACAELGDLRSGQQIHGYSITAGIEMDPTVANAAAKMYFRCREVDSAESALEGRKVSLISNLLRVKGYAFNEKYADVVMIISQGDGFVSLFMEENIIAVSVLSAAANLCLLRLGRQVHGILVTFGYNQSSSLLRDNEDGKFLFNALIGMYSRCSGIKEAWMVFTSLKWRDVSNWNVLISACIYNGLLEQALELFNAMPVKNVVSWTSIISGYVQHRLPRKGLEMLANLYHGEDLVRGNSFTFASALDACSSLAALDAGKQIHAQVLKNPEGDQDNRTVVETALLDMYSRSGNLSYARRVFDHMQNMNVLSWTSMITGYASHGLASGAIEVFSSMVSKGYVPNEVTFVSVLSACSYCGLIEKGLEYFNLMKDRYGIDPKVDHFACLVDMFGRAGKLVEAQNFVERFDDSEMLTKAENVVDDRNASIWGALLGGCKMHGDVEIGSVTVEKMINTKQASDALVALSNLHAASGNWKAAHDLREQWKRRGFTLRPGYSSV